MSEALYLVCGARRRKLTLDRLLGEGAVGKVYAVQGQPELAVKLYHDPKEAAAIAPKIAMMLSNPPDLPALAREGTAYPQIAWPEAQVVDGEGRFRGFAMPMIDLSRSTSLVNLLQKSSRRAEKLSDYYGYRVMVAHNLASMFAELHRAGHHMIDMKPANLRIYPETAWIAVVDTDGFSIAGDKGRMAAGQVSDDYIAPESWRRSAKELGEAQDRFALAVIVFQLLNNGVHPFSGRPAEGAPPQPTDIQTRILKGHYAYGTEANPLVKPSAVSIHKTFRRDTRALFDQAFLPEQARPSAEQWRDHLARLVELLTPCHANPAEHAHFGSGCGFCLYEAQVAAVVANAKPRPKVVAIPRPVQQRPTHALSPVPSNRSNSSRSSGKAKPAKRSARSRRLLRAQLGAALSIGGALTGLLFLGVAIDNVTQTFLSPGAVAAMAPEDDAAVHPLQMETFPIPITYRLLPDQSGQGTQLRLGPGVHFAAADSVSANQRVTGLGESRATDGKAWIWVKLKDGGAGYLPSARLSQVPELFDEEPGAPRYSAVSSGVGDGGAVRTLVNP